MYRRPCMQVAKNRWSKALDKLEGVFVAGERISTAVATRTKLLEAPQMHPFLRVRLWTPVP
jgi:hypothetical protein